GGDNRAVTIDLAADASKLVWSFLTEFRPLLSDKPGTALFPKLSGGPRAPGNFSQGLSDFVLRETGLGSGPIDFRHLSGKMFLDANPGEYETVRRFLGHRKLETTTTFYAGFENKAALARYDATTLSTYKGRKGRKK
ncbi:MAG: hypothetical protein KDK08_10095, partial [Rhizobiaceae bacterium]|nr:hypothetical protein [Rhizobiaceae bacterium]